MPAPDPRRLYEGFAGDSAVMEAVWEQLRAATRTRAAVLVRGESGTGKELIARTLAKAQGEGPWVVVNCCAISESLIESELFGHAKGAFSGADRDREGLFETASGGCIFLDEIGDIPPSAQARLLRVLQEGEVRRVGESRVRHVDVRVIAATNRDLEAAMKSGEFRTDLFYRLSVHPILLPPLRSRREDIPGLVRHLVRKHTRAGATLRSVSAPAMELLRSHPWPGNVRELENVLLRVLAFGGNGPILAEELRPHLRPIVSGMKEEIPIMDLDYPGFRLAMDELERHFIEEHLVRHGGSILGTAQALSIGRTALHNRIRALDMDPAELRRRVKGVSEAISGENT